MVACLPAGGAAQGASPGGEEAPGAAEAPGGACALRRGRGRPLARSTGLCAGAAAHVRPGVPPREIPHAQQPLPLFPPCYRAQDMRLWLTLMCTCPVIHKTNAYENRHAKRTSLQS